MYRKESIVSAFFLIVAFLEIGIAIYAEISSEGELPVYVLSCLIGNGLLFLAYALNPRILILNSYRKPATKNQVYLFILSIVVFLAGSAVYLFSL